MWPEADPNFTQDEFAAWQRRRLAPDNEISVVVPLNQIVLQEADVVMWLSHAECSSSGVAFYLEVRTSRLPPEGTDERESVLMGLFPSREDQEGLHIELQLPDGTRVLDATTVQQPPERIYLLHLHGAAAGVATAQAGWWLSPTPPDTFSVKLGWPALGVVASAEVDAQALLAAAADIRPLWDWT